ncbi:MAG: restriction endonuclease subunit S [Halomonas sp.]|uniref:restriction endonuclease subunit S n=1 Tax=Halomonas sp. TaxID=1486246 RepID=UPI003F8F0ECB
MIPREWQYGLLKDYGKLISGQHIPGELSNRDARGVPYFTGPADFYSGTTIVSSYTEFPQVMCSRGDLLITVKGSGCGKIAVASADACISRQLMAFVFKKAEKRYWHAFFSLNEKMINKIAEGGAIPGVSRQQLLNLPVACPKNEDEYISISKTIAEHNRRRSAEVIQLKKLTKQKAGLMDDLLTGRVRVTPLLEQAQTTTPA